MKLYKIIPDNGPVKFVGTLADRAAALKAYKAAGTSAKAENVDVPVAKAGLMAFLNDLVIPAAD